MSTEAAADTDATPPAGTPAGPRDPAAPDGSAGTPRSRRGRRGGRRGAVVLGIVLAVVALVVGLVVALASRHTGTAPRVLDTDAVQQGVTGVVTRDWRRTITGTRCPDGQPVEAGRSFLCTATVDGRPQQVPVTVLDDAGTYAVGQPR